LRNGGEDVKEVYVMLLNAELFVVDVVDVEVACWFPYSPAVLRLFKLHPASRALAYP
jgi:hypothetical protein